MSNLSREDLIELVRRIMNFERSEEAWEKSDDDPQMSWIEILRNNVPDPRISDYIFYPNKDNLSSREMTPEEIVDKALSYKPIILGSVDNNEGQ